MNAIDRAAAVVGGQARLAALLGITPAAVNQWVKGYRPIPAERCTAIEVATHGQVTRRDLRPSDWQLIWPELAEAEPNAAQTRASRTKTATETVTMEASHV